MTTLLLPSTPVLTQRHWDRRFHTNQRTARDLELSLEDLGIRRNSQLSWNLRGLEHCKSYLETLENRRVECFGSITRKLYDKVLNILIQHKGPDEVTILGNKLARIGLVETLSEFYDFVRNVTGIEALTDAFVKQNDSDGARLLLTMRRILYDFSTASENVIKRLADTDFHSALIADLRCSSDCLPKFEKYSSEGSGIFILNSSMAILYRCVKHPHTKREGFRQAGIINTLIPFLHSSLPHFKLRALLILAYTLVEDKQMWSNIHFDVFEFLIEAINEAVLAKDKRIHGFSIPELIDALTSVQGSYPNKTHFMDKSPLPMITEFLESENQTVIHAAVRLVWALSFWEPNQKMIQENESLMYGLEVLAQANNQGIRFAARKTLFVLRSHRNRVKDGLPRKDLAGRHILLSYHESDQSPVLQIYHALTASGFLVWLDVAEMNKYSDVLDGVVQAVDQSSLIVVCFSENYVTDLSCRLEAEYAFALKKRIVPLKLQSGYEPRGWLTSVIGSKFYLTLTNDSSFEKQMKTLRVYIQGASTTLTANAPVSRAVSRAQFSRGPSRGFSRAVSRVTSRGQQSWCPAYEKNVMDWDKDDVIIWATQFKLEGRAWKAVSKLTVQQIMRVYTVWQRSPEHFYRWAESVIGLGSIEDLLRFRNAVRSLKDYI